MAETSSSRYFLRNRLTRAPATPVKLGQAGPFVEMSLKKTWNDNFGSTTQTYKISGGKFSMDDVAAPVEADSEKESPQETQKRRKHRPKVVTECNPKRARKPTTLKPHESSTKEVEKSTATATSTVGETGRIIHYQTKRGCKRKNAFDEYEKLVVDRTCSMVSEVVGNYQKLHDNESLSPVTPSKSEVGEGRLERKSTKCKCKINFLQVDHDKGPSLLPGCNTSRVERADSLELFLSKYTDYNIGSNQYVHKSVSLGKSHVANKKERGRSIMMSSLYHDRLGYNQNSRCKTIDIDALIGRFERLHINREAVVPYKSGKHEKNALVMYQQEDRQLVPYEGVFNPLKEKKHRPTVDLDEETHKVWTLLLEDITSEGIDGMDSDKEKWWKEERRVFSRRAECFISKMHLIQGDRRFSRWKGSVLDSVVGVFLTQNVTDHLSSSAFMSLAACYPIKQTDTSEPLHAERSHVFVREPYLYKESVNNNQFSKNCVIGVDLNGDINCEVSKKDSSICKEPVINQTEVDEIVCSQNSLYTFSTHKSEEQKDRCKGIKVYVRRTRTNRETHASEASGIAASQTRVRMVNTICSQESENSSCCMVQQVLEIASQNNNIVGATGETVQKVVDFHVNESESSHINNGEREGPSKGKREKTGKTRIEVDWDKLRFEAEIKRKRERTADTMDSMDYEAIRKADVNDVAGAIKGRGMNNRLAERIKNMLDRVAGDHGSIDLEWLRDVPPNKAKEYLLSFRGLGLKSVECVRLLTLHHLAFPVDTNVARIAVRLGWVPLKPLPESLQLHLLELYPIQSTIQKYLWPRLCKLDQKTLYELHYQMITFGKVFCTKTKPNCNACPIRAECRHFASAFASARLALPAPEESITTSAENQNRCDKNPFGMIDLLSTSSEQLQQLSEPVIEEPATPESICIQQDIPDMEDFGMDSEEIPVIKLNIEEFTQNLQTYMEKHIKLEEGDMSKALVALTSEAASIPTPKLKNVRELRTEHQVYELPDSHPLLEGLDTREPDDPCPYLLAIWTPGETADSIQPPEGQCCSKESGTLCNKETCSACNSTREANSRTVRGTLLIPCRTAMRGSFPLNGTYFQVNEVFADKQSSHNPIDVPRDWLWKLQRRTVYFGTSIRTIFKGLTIEEIQLCFWRGFVCVRGFDQKKRKPCQLRPRLHIPASRLKSSKTKTEKETS